MLINGKDERKTKLFKIEQIELFKEFFYISIKFKIDLREGVGNEFQQFFSKDAKNHHDLNKTESNQLLGSSKDPFWNAIKSFWSKT